MTDDKDKLRILVSACLVGHKVRYNAAAKTEPWLIKALAPHANFFPLCPEVAMGLGVPRETLRLRADAQRGPRLLTRSGEDLTERARASNAALLSRCETELDAVILTSASPSCGLRFIKVYDRNNVPHKDGIGLFAEQARAAYPLTPIVESGWLNDAKRREQFLIEVYTLRRFCRLPPGPAALVDFHRQHKFLLRFFDPERFRDLGRLVADAGGVQTIPTRTAYHAALAALLRKRIRRGNVADSLTHMYGFLKDHLSSEQKQRVLRTIRDYQEERVGLATPLTLLGYLATSHQVSYIEEQIMLNPYPADLGSPDGV